ncbi:MAG: cytochrome c1 [Alphaproteobacteria bacterium]
MKRITLAVAGAALAFATGAASVQAAGEGPEIAAQPWSWDGIFGGFDQAQLQRGYLVYEQVCASCHAMALLSFRDLHSLGFNGEQVEAIASNWLVPDIDQESGDAITRQGRPADRLPRPFPNDIAARFANNGAMPPDLSVITKARAAGADYIYALLTGYEDPPEGIELPPGRYYNTAFPGHVISMAPPLADGSVDYIDGTPTTVAQMSRDVSAFLTWAGEPSLVERKELGVKVILFLVVLAGIAYAVKRKVWADVEH